MLKWMIAALLIFYPLASLAGTEKPGAALTPLPLIPKDPRFQLPTEEVTLFYPAKRPDWCSKNANVCYGPEDVAKHTVSSAAGRYTKPWLHPYAKTLDGSPPSQGAACRGGFPKDSSGEVIKAKFHYGGKRKDGFESWRCQPMPDGKARLHVQFKPGHRYNRCAHFFLHGDAIVSSPVGTPLDQRPVFVDYKQQKVRGQRTGAEGNGCIAGRSVRNLTIYGIVVEANAIKPEGGWIVTRGHHYYRCVFAPRGRLTLVNTDLLNCRHGVQGSGKEWLVYNSKILNASFNGNGKTHALYGIGSVNELSIVGSHIQGCGGHAVKAIIKTLNIENSLIEIGVRPECDSGPVIHNSYGGYANLDNVVIERRPIGRKRFNRHFLSTGDGKTSRCKGVEGTRGIWNLSRVTMKNSIFQTGGKSLIQEITGGCKDLKRSRWIDGGGNTYNGRPLEFVDDYPVFTQK